MSVSGAIAPVVQPIVTRVGRRTAAVLLGASSLVGVAGRAERVLAREADHRLAAGDLAGANAIVAALERRPLVDVAAGLRLSKLVRRMGRPQRAAEIAETVLHRGGLDDQQRARALAQLAWARERAGNLPAAIRHLTAAVAQAPGHHPWRRSLAAWHHRLGEEHEQAARWAAATVEYRQAIALDGDHPAWHYRLGRVLEAAGRWEPAAEAYRAAVLGDPRHPEWHERLAHMAARAPAWTVSRAPHRPGAGPTADGSVTGVVAPPVRRAVTGWVPVAAGGDGTVRFLLNRRVIAQTRAAGEVAVAGTTYLRFRRNLRDLWSYAGAGDTLEIEYAGRALPIVDHGTGYVFRGSSRAGELFARLAHGDVFNKYGRVRPSIQLDNEWQSAMFDLFFRLRAELAQAQGLQLFPFYGTMLGAVREQNFIGHDNDFDTVYISSHSSPVAVREEFRTICDFLVDRGYSLRVKKTHTWVRVPGTGRELDTTFSHKLDIFFAWFDEEGYFQTSYGHHGEAIRRSERFFQFRSERLGIREVPVPSNAEEILEQLYGPGWREPDPGFTHFSRTRIMRSEFHLGLGEANEPHWRQFYREHRVDGASSFAGFVAARLPAGCTLIDVGCGSGRDSLYFARCGHQVLGVDRSAEAVGRANEACQEAGVGGARFERLDASSRQDLVRFLSQEQVSGEIVVYLRFFLHAVEESTEDTLMSTLLDALPGGFRLCAEFRTIQDGKLPKVYGDHYRRYLDEQQFAGKLRGHGFEIEHLEAGRGLSPYEGEDPHLARIIARVG